jgi:hypothetical protein
MLSANRDFFAVTGGRQPPGGDSQRFEIILGGVRALRAQSKIIFSRAPLIAVAFDLDSHGGIFLQPIGCCFQRRARVGTQIIAIELEEDFL